MSDDAPTKPSMQAIDPSRTTRDKDLILHRAMVVGYKQAVAHSTAGVVTFSAFRAGVELALDYLKSYDRRTR